MAKSKAHDELIEALCRHKRKRITTKAASKEMKDIYGFEPDVAEALMRSFKGLTVTRIRGHSNEPEHLLKSKVGRVNEFKKK